MGRGLSNHIGTPFSTSWTFSLNNDLILHILDRRLNRLKGIMVTHVRSPQHIVFSIISQGIVTWNCYRFAAIAHTIVVIVEFDHCIGFLGAGSWHCNIFWTSLGILIWVYFWQFNCSEWYLLLIQSLGSWGENRSTSHHGTIWRNLSVFLSKLRGSLSIVGCQGLMRFWHGFSAALLFNFMIGPIKHLIALNTSFISLTLIQIFSSRSYYQSFALNFPWNWLYISGRTWVLISIRWFVLLSYIRGMIEDISLSELLSWYYLCWLLYCTFGMV